MPGGVPMSFIGLAKVIRSPNFTTEWGIRSMPNNEAEYDPDAYHKGNIWGLITGWGACAEFSRGSPENGLNYIKMLISDFSSNCIGGISEVWSGDIKMPMGCAMQGWNSAMVIRAIDDFMLGLKVDAFRSDEPRHCVTVRPRLPDSINEIRRKRRVRDNWVDIDIKRKGDAIISKIGNSEE